ncbi:hypothetical protein V8G54_028886 [Vigna mungo]|uniref:Uncharacterized protein n=1 Tax=Vigna mungo TaxID=3915 RepID=A0AAQ3MTK8_VIGMU
MATGKVVGGIFFAADELLWVEKLAVRSSPNLINHSGLKIHKDGTWNMLSSTCLAEESVESIVTTTNCFVTWHLTIGLHKNHEYQPSVLPLTIFILHNSTIKEISYKS